MNQEINILEAEYLGGYRIRLQFDDGSHQEVDFQPFLKAALHPQIKEFLNLERFRKFRIEYGELVWGDYELCFPITDLYENSIAPEASSMLAA